MTKEYCYSLDGEQFHGRFASPVTAAAMAEDMIDGCSLEDFEERTYWVAECANPIDFIMHDKKEFWAGETFLEQVEEWCADEIAVDDQIIELGRDETAELGRLVFDFLRQRADFPYYAVKNEVQHKYMAGMSELNDFIAAHVRAELLAYLAEGEGATSEYPHRAGMILTPEAKDDRDDFDSAFGDEGCTCFISPPCGYCVHPGNPRNHEECEECWAPVLKGI